MKRRVIGGIHIMERVRVGVAENMLLHSDTEKYRQSQWDRMPSILACACTTQGPCWHVNDSKLG